MEALRVAQQLKDLATDPQNRRTIVRVRKARLRVGYSVVPLRACVYSSYNDSTVLSSQASVLARSK